MPRLAWALAIRGASCSADGQGFPGLFVSAQALQGGPEVAPGVRQVSIQRGSATEGLDSTDAVAGRAQRQPQIVPGGRVVGIVRQVALIGRHGVRGVAVGEQLAGVLQRRAVCDLRCCGRRVGVRQRDEFGQSRRVRRIQAHQALKDLHRQFRPTHQTAQRLQRYYIAPARVGQGSQALPDCFGVCTGFLQHGTQVGARFRIVGWLIDGTAQGFGSPLDLSNVLETDAEIVE